MFDVFLVDQRIQKRDGYVIARIRALFVGWRNRTGVPTCNEIIA